MRSIQCAPPGRVKWLWQSTIPGTIVEPLASTTSAPARTGPASSLGRIHAMRPSSTRMLTADPEPVRPAVGQRAVAVQGGGHAPIVRADDSTTPRRGTRPGR